MYLGIDLGGTKIAYGLADDNLKIKKESKFQTAKNKEAIFKQLTEIITENLDSLQAVGIGIPGMIDNQGKVINAPNLPGWNDFEFKHRLDSLFPQLNIFIENDANCAAIAEKINGPVANYSNFIYITVSTGIGGGIIIDNEIYRGTNGLAGEIGHIILVEDGPLCGCGQRGCWEALASGTAMAKTATQFDELKSFSETINTELLARLATQGNQIAQNIFIQATQYHAQALNNLKVIFDPQAFVIGGGVTNSGPIFWNSLETALSKYSFNIPVLQAANNSGTVGAIALAIRGN